ncbi:MAG: N-acetylmuramoyl-L-alanine amidase [Anaerocolumna sp.]
MICIAVSTPEDSVINVLKNGSNMASSKTKETIVIDPGHGGRDPGKVGIGDILEKDINLKVAQKLKVLLEQNDYNVVMTRTDDSGLYSESDANKKVSDMRKRVEIINSSNASLAISIHQNSFTMEEIRGAQVFYYSTSEDGKAYANILQDQLKKTLNDGNKRQAKANNEYFMLKKSQVPIVIIEGGYLSNNAEAQLLNTEEYQEKMAWAIHLGIIKYLNTHKSNER